MAVPWFRILDAGVGLFQYARSRKALGAAAADQTLEPRSGGGGVFGGLETRLAGVVVAALKEAFDRDARRLDLEREQLEAERLRAERALKLELLRQAADREIGRLRLLAGVAVASFIGTLLFASRVIAAGMAARVMLGIGWALLLGALAVSFTAQSGVEEALRREATPPTDASLFAPWLIVAALASIGIAALIA
jgi:hypothetical protein